MEEEHPQEYYQHQLNQLMSVSHLGLKLSKIQIQQINFQSIFKQCNNLLTNGVSIRECSQYLQGMAVVYLKQYSILKSDIQQLQLAMMKKENFVEIDKAQSQQQKKTKSKRPREQQVKRDALLELQENSDHSIDNPRNIASNERIQLEESQRSPYDINVMLRKNDSDSKIIEESYVAQEVKSLEKQSLKEVIQNRKNRRENSDKNSNSSKSTPVPRITVQNENGQIEFMEQFEQNENKIEEQMMSLDITDEVVQRHKTIMETLENFGLHLMEKDKVLDSQVQQIKKINKKKGLGIIDDKEIEKDVINEEYKQNLDQFMRYQDKIDELKIKMNVLNKQPHFWQEQNDDLMNIINDFDVAQNTTDIHIKQQNPQSHSKYQGMTTIDNSNLMQEQNDNFIEEFQHNSIKDESNLKQEQKQEYNNEYYEEQQHYNTIISDLRMKSQNKQQIEQFEYFQLREQEGINKGQAFYDVLVMGRLGKIQIEQQIEIGRYSQMIYKF